MSLVELIKYYWSKCINREAEDDDSEGRLSCDVQLIERFIRVESLISLIEHLQFIYHLKFNIEMKLQYLSII